MPIQRMRSDDLLAAVFPAQASCQDNAPAGEDVEPPDHPLVFETLRNCLTEAMDVDGLRGLLASIETESIDVYARDTTQPSVFSHQILNAMPYAFLDNAPLEERRSRAVALRRALPEHPGDLGALDGEAIDAAARDAWPLIRDIHELHDALLTLGVLPEDQAHRGGGDQDQLRAWFEALVDGARALRLHHADHCVSWVAAENAGLAAAVYPTAHLEPTSLPATSAGPLAERPPSGPTPDRDHREPQAPDEEEATLALVRGWVESTGPFTAAELASTLGLMPLSLDAALARLEGEGLVLRGRFRPGSTDEEFCDRRILARIHRTTVDRLRREIQPISPAGFIRFLFRWQHAAPSARLRGDGGVLEAVEQLQGFEAAAGAWESDLLHLRVAEYDPAMLDRLCLGGELVWGRFARRHAGGDSTPVRNPLSRTGPVSLGLREDLPWLLEKPPEDAIALTGAAQEVMGFLSSWGASFLPDIVAGTGRLPADVEDGLWQLVAAGLVTADGFGALRGLISGAARRQHTSRFRPRPRRRLQSSRWSLLKSVVPHDDAVEERGCSAFATLRCGLPGGACPRRHGPLVAVPAPRIPQSGGPRRGSRWTIRRRVHGRAVRPPGSRRRPARCGQGAPHRRAGPGVRLRPSQRGRCADPRPPRAGGARHTGDLQGRRTRGLAAGPPGAPLSRPASPGGAQAEPAPRTGAGASAAAPLTPPRASPDTPDY